MSIPFNPNDPLDDDEDDSYSAQHEDDLITHLERQAELKIERDNAKW